LTGSVETFSEDSERRRLFLSGLASMLAIPQSQIVIISVKSGSVIIELGFLRTSASSVSPIQATLLLKEATAAGRLDSFGATGLTIGGQSVLAPSSSQSQLPLSLIVGSSVGGFLAFVIIVVIIKYARNFIEKYKQNKVNAARAEEIAKKLSMNEFLIISDDELEYDSRIQPVSGNFGDVRKAVWNGIDVAVKTLKRNISEEDRQNFNREARLMHSVNHPNCVRLYGVSSTNNAASLVMEWMGGGDLSNFLKQAPPPPNAQAYCIIQANMRRFVLSPLSKVNRAF
jgi:hypothetical protein